MNMIDFNILDINIFMNDMWQKYDRVTIRARHTYNVLKSRAT